MSRMVRALIFVLCISGSWQGVTACVCAISPYPADRFADSGAVFVGEVVDKSARPPLNDRGFGIIAVGFAVERAWKGTFVGEYFVVETTISSCGFHFEEGKSYLVYARRQQDRLLTGTCAGNCLSSQAVFEMAYLDALVSGEPTGRIFGRSFFQWTDDPVGKTVEVEDSEGLVRTTRTIARGDFVIEGLSAGTYIVRIPTPAPINPDPAEQTVKLRRPGDAVKVNIGSRYGGRVTFRVLDEAGAPAANLRAYPQHPARTDADGVVTLRHLRPGQHRIGVLFDQKFDVKTAWVHPGALGLAGDPIDVAPGEVIELPDLLLPFRLKLCSSAIQLQLPDGMGLADASIQVSQGGPVAELTTDGGGWAFFEGYAQVEYGLWAGVRDEEAQRITHNVELSEFNPCAAEKVYLRLQELPRR